jgi:Rho GDP-dissociation inhibitor
MAEHPEELDANEEDTPGYKPPAQKSLGEILQTDAEDESLRKYKEKLLGSVNPEECVKFPEDPRRVIVQKLELIAPDGPPDMTIDLSGNINELKKKTFVLKEGCQYQVRIHFYVQREIVTGMKYIQKSYRKGIAVDKTTFMVGSYGPNLEMHSYTTPMDEAPSGMLARGSYTVKSLFTDDDKHEYLKWEWGLEIKKDWE